ncbi:hypothetical protein J1N35_032824 [Gossypium stocksii]|uniref:RING-type domain-containing protein n=1 Tax=Gossypium stocksii TaxID=47602 RepID=A0A9D3ZWI0_9ROSI|nr:hypothetical protein J1N35_032824 [Gossypium stocksii]
MLVPLPGLGSFEACDRGGETLVADGSTCAICLEGLSNGTCVKTPCSHAFHGRCFARWVWRKKSCPTCRRAIPTHVWKARPAGYTFQEARLAGRAFPQNRPISLNNFKTGLNT